MSTCRICNGDGVTVNPSTLPHATKVEGQPLCSAEGTPLRVRLCGCDRGRERLVETIDDLPSPASVALAGFSAAEARARGADAARSERGRGQSAGGRGKLGRPRLTATAGQKPQ